MKGYVILGILINQRSEVAVEVQEVLTKFGCIIKLRLGLHETANVCAEDAFLLLQLDGSKEEITTLQESLNIIDGVETKLISLGN
ncbi:MAG: hypothetical protein K9L02_01015 [Acholeplasmataceae bacterium]|nr:hypothetical protein [Acholeplasmataceae bacterium]